MGKETINNGESGGLIRSKLNSMFTELYLPKKGLIAVDESGSDVVFSEAYPIGVNYDILPYCYSDGSPIGFTITNVTRAGFHVVSAESGIFIYQTIIL